MSTPPITERRAARYLGIPRAELRRLREEGAVEAAGYVQYRTALYDLDELDTFAALAGIRREYRFGDERIVLIDDEQAPTLARRVRGVRS
jgi:hypothetical protein